MRVFVYPCDDGGCGRYRLRWPAEALRRDGYDVEVHAINELRGAFSPSGRLVDVLAPECDVIVLQRPTDSRRVDAIPLLQAKGVTVVVEVDDDFQSVDPRNVGAAAFHPKANPQQNWHHLARACRVADMVTVTTPPLADRYGRHGRVAVLPNYVPRWYLGLTEKPTPSRGAGVQALAPCTTLGWTGTPLTHPGDLDVAGDAVARSLGASARFRAIGSQLTLQALGIFHGGEAVEWTDLDGSYQRAVAGLDIGIVPLRDSVFNAAKSWLKGLEYAALGVPFVASPTAEYRRLHDLGAGILAGKPKRWLQTLHALIASPGLRDEVAARGREAAAKLVIEDHADRWWLAWMEARAQHIARAA